MRLGAAVLLFLVGAVELEATSQVARGSVVVEYEDGLLRVQCSMAAVSTVFEEIAFVAGVKPIVDQAVRDIPLTADIEPSSMRKAIEELLAGARLNYAMMMSARDPLTVESVYVAAATAPKPGAPPSPMSNRPRRSSRRRTKRAAASTATTRKTPTTPRPATRRETGRPPSASGEEFDERRWDATGHNADGSTELGQDYERAVEEDDYADDDYYADDPYYDGDDGYGEQVASDFEAEADELEEPEFYDETGEERSSIFDEPDGSYTPHLDAFGRPIPSRRKDE